MKSTNIRYLPAVDHLRGFAALLIVFYHGLQLFRNELALHQPLTEVDWIRTKNPFLALIVEGHTSVGFFMVLSGFIFTFGTLDREITYWRFMGNRILRIYPLYVFVMMISAYAAPQGLTLLGFLADLLFMSNMSFGALNTTFLGVGWAVSVEFQFYLIFPFVMRFVRTYGVRYLFGLLAVMWIYRFLSTLGSASLHDLSYWTIVGRLDQFIVGILAGVIYLRRPEWVRRARVLFPISAAGVLGMVYFFHANGGFSKGSALLWFFWPPAEAVAWSAFVLCYIGVAEAIPNALSRLLSRFGELSFSIYITHFLILTFLCSRHVVFAVAKDLTLSALVYTACVALPVVALVSMLTWFVIERPFLMMRKSYVTGIGGRV